MNKDPGVYTHDNLKKAAHEHLSRQGNRRPLKTSRRATVHHLSSESRSALHTAPPNHTEFHLSDHGQIKIRAINKLLTPKAGDIVLVYGKFGDQTRQAVRLDYNDAVVQTPLNDVLAQAAKVYAEVGKTCDLDIYVTPPSGMNEKSHHQHDWHFSICSDADWHRLLDKEQHRHSHGGRETEADRLRHVLAGKAHPAARPEMKVVQHAGQRYHHS